ncbi:hypothetical protein HY479_01230 [Candidatus Uhrbacteria bacterium]|nr:hypothetical protein [Candidatus Uhrbacteria bacterium]
MNSIVTRVLFPLAALVFLGQGCFGPSQPKATGPDGGVWKTKDRGLAWVNKRALVTGPKVTADASNFSVVAMAFDPQDANAIYAATAEHGLAFSLDAGESWQISRALPQGRVNAVAVDSKNKCTVYAAMANKIFKTETCTRDWNQIFFDPQTSKQFTQLVVDWFNPTILYAGTSDGDVLKSTDAGISWQVVKRIDGVGVSSMIMDPRDSRLLYVGTNGEGILKTLDGGNTWLQIKKQFGDEFREARRVVQIALDPRNSNILFVVSKFGIIRSEDQGETWSALPLTSPPGTVKITALAVDPTDSAKLIYTGPATLILSADGGKTWTAKKLPTSKIGSTLLVDPKNGDVIYLGTQPPEKK